MSDLEPLIPRNLKVPTKSSLALRPFGYLGVGAAWWLVLLIGLSVFAIMPVAFAANPLSESRSLHFHNISDLIPFIIVMVILIAVSGVMVFIILAPIIQIMLSSGLFVQSLSLKLRGGKLSGTVEDRGAGLSAISLIPLHPTKYSQFWGKMAIMVFRFGWRTFLSLSVTGSAYVFAVAFIYWPVTNPVLLGIFWVVTVALAATGLVLLGRAYKVFVPQNSKLILK